MPHYVDEQAIVERLREICADRLSNTFARKYGISKSRVSEVLNGKRRPNAQIIAALGYSTTRYYRKPARAAK